ncbi:MAG: hypothetical protein H7259_06865 [Cytophagales bacterium]|nr:hypothetical protein [Cytophaga sp.]
MKNVIKQSIVAGIFSLALLMGSVVNAKIPAHVEKALLERYPEAHDVAWKNYAKDEYQVSFVVNDQEGHAFIHSSGEFIESHIQLSDENIPEGIAEQLSKIKNVSLHYVLNTVDANNFEYYRAKIKVENEMYEVNFDKNHRMISKHLIN